MINVITLVGRMASDPELRYTQSGIPVANFCIAVERDFKEADGNKITDFFQVVAWRKTGELAHQYLKKGNNVGIVGRLITEKYVSKEGENRVAHKVQAETVQFLGSKANSAENETSPDTANQVSGDVDDLLPF
jgi:single-strand DNA-binding protein